MLSPWSQPPFCRGVCRSRSGLRFSQGFKEELVAITPHGASIPHRTSFERNALKADAAAPWLSRVQGDGRRLGAHAAWDRPEIEPTWSPQQAGMRHEPNPGLWHTPASLCCIRATPGRHTAGTQRLDPACPMTSAMVLSDTGCGCLGLAPIRPCARIPSWKDTSRALLVLFTLASNQFYRTRRGHTHDVERSPGGHDGP